MEPNDRHVDRREFLRYSGGAGAATVFPFGVPDSDRTAVGDAEDSRDDSDRTPSVAGRLFLSFPDGQSVDITGESTVSGHEGDVELLNWGWGASASWSVGSQPVGRPNFQALTVEKYVDSATPSLMRALASGARLEEAVLTAEPVTGGLSDPFLTIRLGDVVVASVVNGGTVGTAFRETVRLGYNVVEVEYRPVDRTGKYGPPVRFEWNVLQNTPL